jgi:hypothetical protein
LFTLQTREFFKCSKEEKRACLATAAEVMRLAEIARTGGLLALDGFGDGYDDPVMRVGLKLITDGVDPADVRDILETHIISSFKSGAELLSDVIAMEGILLMQDGIHPKIITKRLLAYLGGDFTEAEAEDLVYANDESLRALAEDAERGDAEAQYALGCRYYEGDGAPQDYAQAVSWFLKAAERGHMEAQFMAGRCYVRGCGVELDYNESARWFEKAARQGHARAQYMLGAAYEDSNVFGFDYEKAFSWYIKAAEQGYADAQYDVAAMYRKGRGVGQDLNEAIKWDRAAAENGTAEAAEALRELGETWESEETGDEW